MFAYCNNNPIVLYDQSGQIPAVAVAIFGIILECVTNNVQNAVTYNNASNTSDLTEDTYTSRKPTREEKMAYVKKETQEEKYSTNTWRYYSEYTLHEYGWYITGWAYGKNIPVISNWADKFKTADINKDKWDERDHVNVFTFIIGVLGI